MRRLAVAVAAVAVMAVSASSAAAHDVGPTVGPHVHVLTTPGNVISIGPDGCGADALAAFQDFHYHVHVGQPGMSAFLGTNPVSIRGAMCPLVP
jgi:hypothetical protein